jgi:hypothetical protein
VTANENLQVIQVEPGSAAEKAGVQVGDILLDLTWIPSDAPAYSPESSDVVYTDTARIEDATEAMTDTLAAGIAPISILATPVLPVAVAPIPPPVESYIETETVPFTDSVRIISLAGVGVPLKLRLQRGDQVLELTITPTPRVGHPLAPGEPTRTPVWPPNYYY